MNNFDDIRPYNDSEVKPTIKRLLADQEFLQAVVRFRFPKMPEFLVSALSPVIRFYLAKQSKHFSSVNDLQLVVERYMKRMIDQTISDLHISGMENLSEGVPYLFISNHRDIAMDPALVNWALYHNGHKTLRIAIGDNLLTKAYVADLMRLNKSFIVNRSTTAPREKLKAAKYLSSYIRHSLDNDKANVWLAQREGRAKDGLDRTNSAVVSMLALAKDKKQSLGDYSKLLNIVPVSISYEYDPCDEAKARELYFQKEHGEYEKEQHEDAGSIAKGITGFKGHVHLHFGKPLVRDYQNADELVADIDREIIQNYHLHPSNMVAYKILHGDCDCEILNLPDFHAGDLLRHKQQFEQRMAECDSRWRDILISMYANPVVSQQGLVEQ